MQSVICNSKTARQEQRTRTGESAGSLGTIAQESRSKAVWASGGRVSIVSGRNASAGNSNPAVLRGVDLTGRLVSGVLSFIFFFKSKGDPDDRTKYRGLAQQEVAAKLLPSLLLEWITYEIGEPWVAQRADQERERVIAPKCAMAEVQNKVGFGGSLSSQNHSPLNGHINQTNSTLTGTSTNFTTGTFIKLSPDAEVFPNPSTREQGDKVVADNQGDVIFPPDSQDTGELQEVTHDSSQDTTDFKQKVTNSHQKVTLPAANSRQHS